MAIILFTKNDDEVWSMKYEESHSIPKLTAKQNIV